MGLESVVLTRFLRGERHHQCGVDLTGQAGSRRELVHVHGHLGDEREKRRGRERKKGMREERS